MLVVTVVGMTSTITPSAGWAQTDGPPPPIVDTGDQAADIMSAISLTGALVCASADFVYLADWSWVPPGWAWTQIGMAALNIGVAGWQLSIPHARHSLGVMGLITGGLMVTHSVLSLSHS